MGRLRPSPHLPTALLPSVTAVRKCPELVFVRLRFDVYGRLLPDPRPRRALMERIARKGAAGRTVMLKLNFSDFTQITRARSLPQLVGDRAAIQDQTRRLLAAELSLALSVRLLGVTFSGLGSPAPEVEGLL